MLKLAIKTDFLQFTLDIDLEIMPSFTALFGPSGSGKTTTLNAIAGLLRPREGEIRLNDRVLFSSALGIDLPPQQRDIGYIFQEGRLFPHLSVKQNLEFGLQRVPKERRRFQFTEIVEVLGVGPLLDRRPNDLSGGEKQRVTLGRTLLCSPNYLLMDEPLSALDFSARLSFLNFLKEMHQRFELPLLYISHDLGDVLNFAEQVVVLNRGQNVACGSPYSVLSQMRSAPLVAREDIPNLFKVEVTAHNKDKGCTFGRGGRVCFTLPHLECPVGTQLLLNIPASEIILAVDQPKNLSASNILPGTISKLHHLGERILAEIAAGETFVVEIIPATIHRLKLEIGKKVFLIIKASSFRRLET